jgi:hypothetical protein
MQQIIIIIDHEVLAPETESDAFVPDPHKKGTGAGRSWSHLRINNLP